MTITEQVRAAAEEIDRRVAAIAPSERVVKIVEIITRHVQSPSVSPETIIYNIAQRDPNYRKWLIEQLTALGDEQDKEPLRQVRFVSVTECIEEVKRLRDEFDAEAAATEDYERGASLGCAKEALETAIERLQSLQGKAGVSEPRCSFCDHPESDHARGQMRRTEPCEAPDCDCGNYAATPSSVEAPLVNTGTIWKLVETSSKRGVTQSSYAKAEAIVKRYTNDGEITLVDANWATYQIALALDSVTPAAAPEPQSPRCDTGMVSTMDSEVLEAAQQWADKMRKLFSIDFPDSFWLPRVRDYAYGYNNALRAAKGLPPHYPQIFTPQSPRPPDSGSTDNHLIQSPSISNSAYREQSPRVCMKCGHDEGWFFKGYGICMWNTSESVIPARCGCECVFPGSDCDTENKST